jgi:geranylgeranyl reductase family protein
MYDVAVIGAGPAGSIAASILAQAHARVLLVDRAAFPRDKPCGDLVSPEAVDIVRVVGAGARFDQHNFFPIDTARLVSARKRAVELRFGRAGYVAPRSAFDALLWQHAIACGATFHQLEVSAPLLHDGRVVGVHGKEVDGRQTTSEVRAHVTIVANGSSGSIGRTLGWDKPAPQHTGVAIRAYVEMSALEHVIEGYLLSDFVPGYAWIFPVNAHLANVGLGTRADILRRKQLSLLHGLRQFLTSPAVLPRIPDLKTLSPPKTWMLRYSTPSLPRVYPGVMFVGDAGSFVNPLTGDGIYPAMLTARLAAQVALSTLESGAVSSATLTAYERLWRETLAWPLRRDDTLQRLLEAWPTVAESFITYWRMRSAQGKTYTWFSHKILPFG